MIKYSIIIPCYNSEGFIRICIESLSQLSFDTKFYEVIFVDDCSTDNTVSIIESYKNKTDLNIRLIQNEVNSGPGVSRRKAAELAKGDYLCFCDSDDFFSPNILEDVDEEITNSNSDMVIFDMSYILAGKVIRKNYTSTFTYGDKLSYLSNCTESLCNLVVRRSIFLSIPTIDIRNGEDLALVPLMIVKADRITHVDNSYYNYVMRGDSASLGRLSKGAYGSMLLAFNHIRNHIDSNNSKINQCIEYLGIKTVLYNSTLMAIKGGNDNSLIKKIVSDFSSNYPSWRHNPYMRKFGIIKNLYLWFLYLHFWSFCRTYVAMHSYYLTR